MDDLGACGQVFYVGISDTPSWQVAGCRRWPTCGLVTAGGAQVEYSLIERTPDATSSDGAELGMDLPCAAGQRGSSGKYTG